MKKILLCLMILLWSYTVLAQAQSESLKAVLDTFAIEHPALNETVRIDITGLTLYDFLNSIAAEHQINISADSDLSQVVESSFYDISVIDIFLFVAKKYDVDIQIINNIIVFKKPEIERKVVKKEAPKELNITYNKENDFLSLKLSQDSLHSVAKKITDLSNKNIIISRAINDELISSYIINRPFDQVLEMMAQSNNLALSIDDNGFYVLGKQINDSNTSKGGTKASSVQKLEALKSTAEVDILPNGQLSIKAYDADVFSLIALVAEKMGINYFMYNKPEVLTTTMVASNFSFDELLDHIFKGKKFTYKKKEGFYLIGDQNTEGLRSTELIQLQNRTIETVMEILPADLISDVEIKEFIELNGFVVAGSRPRIEEIKEYIKQIDVVVPMILIEVLIVQYQKSNEIKTGIQAGLSNEVKPTSGVLFPTADVQLNSSSINSLIEAFNGFGIFNLGKVTENFYMSLRALENNSIINMKSTPKISTLNGHDASISIGETSYYFEQNNRLINSGLGNDILQSGQWKSTDANLSVNIKPFVSRDEQITLNIVVERSSFLGRQGENAPPGKATQQFESLIRVRNGEMILLGGLDELERENSGTGTPLLSRIPIIKWFFSSRSKRAEKSKLHVFIKPTVVY